MSKRVEVDVKGWKGSVTFHEPLNMEQVFAIEDAQDSAVDTPDSKFLKKVQEVAGQEVQKVSWSRRSDKLFLPPIFKCVEKWEIEGLPQDVTAESFPMTPRGKIHDLIDWLYGQLMTIYSGETDIPNES